MKSLKIAIVDDDQIYQFIINRTITKLHPDSKILNFPNCADFYNFLRRNTEDASLLPDLVLIDLNTPFMDGWEFLAAYDTLHPQLAKLPQIYLVTSSVDPNDVSRADEHQTLAGFFSKPLTPEQLLETIHDVCSKQQS